MKRILSFLVAVALVAACNASAPTSDSTNLTRPDSLKRANDGWSCPPGSTWSVRSGVEGCWPDDGGE